MTQRELLAAGLLELLHHLLERAGRAGRAQRLAALPRAIIRDLARPAVVFDDGKRVARFRRGIEAENLHRHRRSRLRHGLAAIVDERTHAPPGGAGDDDIADVQGAALHEHGADRSTPALQLGLDDDAFGGTVGIGLELEQLGLQQDRFQQPVDAGLLEGGNLDLERLARHALHDHLVLQQVGAHPLGVGVRLVDLVDGDDHLHAGGLGVIDRLHRLRHDAVVGGHHQHHEVGDLGAARAHGRERLVAGRVDEGDLLAARRGDLIGADVLGDAAGLAPRHVGLADGVEQRRLAVIDVAHDGDDGRPRLQVRRRHRPCR